VALFSENIDRLNVLTENEITCSQESHRGGVYIFEKNIAGQQMTKRQGMVLEFIKQYIAVHGFPPSFDDIAQGLKLRSRSNVHRMVHHLKKDGMLTMKAKKFRSIQLIDKTVDQVNSL